MEDLQRSNLPGIRKALRKLGAVVAEVDREFRYVWIDNPDPVFNASAMIGKRDDELLPHEEAQAMISLKREVFALRLPISRTFCFDRSDGQRAYVLVAYPVRDAEGRIDGVLTVGLDFASMQRRKSVRRSPTAGRA